MELAVGEVQLGSRRLFAVTVRDITERRQLEKQVLEISDHERRRIAQDLHDGLCQHLAATEFATQLLTDNLAQQSLPQATEARQIGGFIQRAMTQAHEIATGFTPSKSGLAVWWPPWTICPPRCKTSFHIACIVKANGAADLFDDKEVDPNLPDRARGGRERDQARQALTHPDRTVRRRVSESSWR